MVPERVTPIEACTRYVPEHPINDIASATSQRILTDTTKTLVVTGKMLKQFLGMNVTRSMSYMKYPRIRMYWARKTRVPHIADVMSCNNFFLIRSNLTVRNYIEVPQQEKSKDKFLKVWPLIQSVRSACLANPKPQCLSIDEQKIPFHGHASMRQYVKGKPNPLGIKNFVCASPDGLPVDFFSTKARETVSSMLKHQYPLNWVKRLS